MRKAKIKSKQIGVVLPEFGEINNRPFSGDTWLDTNQPRQTILERNNSSSRTLAATLDRTDNHTIGELFTRELEFTNNLTPSCLEMFPSFKSEIGVTVGRTFYSYRGRLIEVNGSTYFAPVVVDANTIGHATTFDQGLGVFDIKIVAETETYFLIQLTSPNVDSFSSAVGTLNAHRGNSVMVSLGKVDANVTTLFFGYFNAHFVGKLGALPRHDASDKYHVLIESLHTVQFNVHTEQPELYPVRLGSHTMEGHTGISDSTGAPGQGANLYVMSFGDDMKQSNSIRFKHIGNMGEGYITSNTHGVGTPTSMFSRFAYGAHADSLRGTPQTSHKLSVRQVVLSPDQKFMAVVCSYKPYLRILDCETMLWLDSYSVSRHSYAQNVPSTGNLANSRYSQLYRSLDNYEETIFSSSQFDTNLTVNKVLRRGKSTNDTDGWRSLAIPTNQNPVLINLTFVTPRRISGYKIESLFGNGASLPSTWELQASEDEFAWELLHAGDNTVTGNDAVLEYNVSTSKAYRFYRLRITGSNSGSNVAIGRFYLRNYAYGTLPEFGIVEEACFSVTGLLATADHNGSGYTVYDLQNMTVLNTPSLSTSGMSVDFSDDGSKLVVGHYGVNGHTLINTSDWSVVSATPMIYARVPTSTYSQSTGRTDTDAISISPDNNMVAVGHQGIVTLGYLDLHDGQWKTGPNGTASQGGCSKLFFSEDGSMLNTLPRSFHLTGNITGNSYNVTNSGLSLRTTITPPTIGISVSYVMNDVAYHKGFGFIFGSAEAAAQRSVGVIALSGHTTFVPKVGNLSRNMATRAVCVSACGRRVYAAYNNTHQQIDVYSVLTGSLVLGNIQDLDATTINIGQFPTAIAADPSGRYFVTGGSALHVHDVDTEGYPVSTVVHTKAISGVNTIQFDKGGKYCAVGMSTSPFLVVYDTSTWDPVTINISGLANVTALDFSADCSKLWLVSGRSTIRCVDMTTLAEFVGNGSNQSAMLTCRQVRFQRGGTRYVTLHNGQQKMDIFDYSDGIARVTGIPSPTHRLSKVEYRGNQLFLFSQEYGYVVFSNTGSVWTQVATYSAANNSDFVDLGRYYVRVPINGTSPVVFDKLANRTTTLAAIAEHQSTVSPKLAVTLDTMYMASSSGIFKNRLRAGMLFNVRPTIDSGNIGARSSLMVGFDKSLTDVVGTSGTEFLFFGKKNKGMLNTGGAITHTLKLDNDYAIFKHNLETGATEHIVDVPLPESYLAARWTISGNTSVDQNMLTLVSGKVFRNSDYVMVYLDNGGLDYLQYLNASTDVMRRHEVPRLQPTLMRIPIVDHAVDVASNWEHKMFPYGFGINFKPRAIQPYADGLLLTPRRRNVSIDILSPEYQPDSVSSKLVLLNFEDFEVIDVGDTNSLVSTERRSLGIASVSIGSGNDIYVLDGDRNQYIIQNRPTEPTVNLVYSNETLTLTLELEGKHNVTVVLEGCTYEDQRVFTVTVEDSTVLEIDPLSDVLHAYVTNCVEID